MKADGRGGRRGVSGVRTLATATVLASSFVLLVVGCGSRDSATLLRKVSATWQGEGAAGGMRIRLDESEGTLVGLGPNGSVLDSMAVQVEKVVPDSGLVRLQRTETEIPFTLRLLDPASDGRSRILLSFPNGREVRLVFRSPLPSDSGAREEPTREGSTSS